MAIQKLSGATFSQSLPSQVSFPFATPSHHWPHEITFEFSQAKCFFQAGDCSQKKKGPRFNQEREIFETAPGWIHGAVGNIKSLKI
jgi:hypothetical protein